MIKPTLWILMLALFSSGFAQAVEKPRVWVTNDVLKGPLGDEDDDVCMAVLLLLADHYYIEGITVNAVPKYVAGTDIWARETFIADYLSEVDRLNAHFDNQYQTEVSVYMADSAGEFFRDLQHEVTSPNYLERNPAIKALLNAASEGPLYLLNWGSLTEIALVIKYCLAKEKEEILQNITIISHWTQRGGPWNCESDEGGCNYVHDQARSNPNVVMYELGPSGQNGLVENICGDDSSLDPNIMLASEIGKHLDAKWLRDCSKCEDTADFSDAATLFVLMGLAGGLDSFEKNGTIIDQEKLDDLLCNDREAIFAKLEERASVASGGRRLELDLEYILSLTAPQLLTARKRIYKVSIDYDVNEERDIVVVFQDRTNYRVWGTGRASVNAGTGTVDVIVPIKRQAPAYEKYHWQSFITARGGDWKQRVHSKSLSDVFFK